MPSLQPIDLLPHQIPPADSWGEWELIDPDRGAGISTAGAHQMARIIVENPGVQIVLAAHDLTGVHACMLEPILRRLGVGQATGISQNVMAIEGRILIFLSLLQLELNVVRGREIGAAWFDDVGGHGAIKEAMGCVRPALRRAPGQIVMTGRTPYSRHSVVRGAPIAASGFEGIPRPKNPPPATGIEVA